MLNQVNLKTSYLCIILKVSIYYGLNLSESCTIIIISMSRIHGGNLKIQKVATDKVVY